MEQEKLTKTEALVAVASGTLTGVIDSMFIKDIDLREAHRWGVEEAQQIVSKFAESRGLKCKNFADTVRNLENKYPMAGDKLTNDFGAGNYHHLWDFSHHPTPLGLMFSILTQFTGKGYGTDVAGNFVSKEIKDWQRPSLVDGIFAGTLGWFFHLLSDVAGSSSTLEVGKEGTGIPGPMLSALKMLSSSPGIKEIFGEEKGSAPENDRYVFSQKCTGLFMGKTFAQRDENGKIIKDSMIPFDLRTELGIVNESLKNKQYIPVLLNEIIVSSFYSISRFVDEIKTLEVSCIGDLDRVNIKRCLPWNNDVLRHMRAIASVTFSTIDFSVAGIKAYVKNKDNKAGFALDFIQGINFWGLGDLALASNSEAAMLVRNSFEKFSDIAQKKKEDIVNSIPNGGEWIETAEKGASAAGRIAGIASPIGFAVATIEVYKDLSESIKEYNIAKEERIRIEKTCAERIALIQENQELIDRTVSDYFIGNYEVFDMAFSKMDHAVTTNNSDEFIEGNVMIQEKLEYDTQFKNQSEFNSLMGNDESFKL